MEFRASFRASGGSSRPPPQGMFKALRRLHGQNLESRGLNDMTEAFQSFVTRARFFSVGKLRRTWSHSAVEFMKYRRLLPMLLADGQHFDSMETDDFDAALAFQATSKDDRKVLVSNISPRITQSQLQSFFSQFGKVSHCSLPREEKRHSIFATLPKNTKNCGNATITFKRSEDAAKARAATEEQLKFYDQVMVVSEYVSRRKGGKGMVLSDEPKDEGNLSRASSTQSLASTNMSVSTSEGCSLDDLPSNVLERIVSFLPVMDTVRVERVNKRWMEASMKSWSLIHSLCMARECDSLRGFGKNKPLRTSHLRAILSRAGAHLRSFDISGVAHLMDDKALEVISRNCPDLIELDLSGVRASWEALGELSEALPSLRRLSYRDMPTAADKAFWFLVKGCGRSLHYVDLRGCRRLHGRCFKLLADQLEMLYLDGCSQVDSMAFEDLCTGATGLKELRVNECYRITDENLSMISRTMSELQVFSLCGDRFDQLTTSGLGHISHMDTIVELALDYNPLVDDSLLCSIATGLPHLRTLSLVNAGSDQSITGQGLTALAQLQHLEQLDVSSLAAVRSPVLSSLSSSSSLELLQLRNCTYLSDQGVAALAACKQIRHIDLSGSILITNESIQLVIKAFPHGGEKCTPITVVVGGTAADASRLAVRGSRVVVDFSDYSTMMSLPSSQSAQFRMGSASDEEASDDEFESLTAQRSFYIDAVCGEDDSPLENEKQMQEWAEREARSLGLIGK